MTKRHLTLADYAHLLPKPGRRRMSDEEAKRFAASFEANKTDYERAQGKPDVGGVTKEVGMQMITAVADAMERRQKKKGRT